MQLPRAVRGGQRLGRVDADVDVPLEEPEVGVAKRREVAAAAERTGELAARVRIEGGVAAGARAQEAENLGAAHAAALDGGSRGPGLGWGESGGDGEEGVHAEQRYSTGLTCPSSERL